MISWTILYILVGLSSFLITAVIVPVAVYLGHKWNLIDHPNKRKMHSTPTVRSGGLAILAGIVLPAIITAIIIFERTTIVKLNFLQNNILIHLNGAYSKLPELVALIVGVLLISLIGLYDDYKGLSAKKKLMLQLLPTILIVSIGVRLSLFIDNNSIGKIVCNLLTVLWIIGITNSFNLLDNTDGLCSGIALIISIVLLIIAMMTGQLFIAAMLSIVVGTSLGFLIYNFPNARIFLGDTGSLIFGFFLSVVVVLFTFYQSNSDYPVMTILVPLYLFAVPILDTLWVIFWRMREGVSIFIPDKRHLSHKLMSIGFGKTQAVIFIWLLTIGCGLSGIILYKLQAYFVYLSLAQLLIFLVLVTLILAQKGSK